MLKGLKSIFLRRLDDDQEAASREIGLLVWQLDELLTQRLSGVPLAQARAKLLECASWAHVGLLDRSGAERKDVPVPRTPKS